MLTPQRNYADLLAVFFPQHQEGQNSDFMEDDDPTMPANKILAEALRPGMIIEYSGSTGMVISTKHHERDNVKLIEIHLCDLDAEMPKRAVTWRLNNATFPLVTAPNPAKRARAMEFLAEQNPTIQDLRQIFQSARYLVHIGKWGITVHFFGSTNYNVHADEILSRFPFLRKFHGQRSDPSFQGQSLRDGNIEYWIHSPRSQPKLIN